MPHKSFEVYVELKVLVWARESMGRNIEEVANRLHVSNDLVKRWESGEKKPTLNQLKKLADYYRRPIAVFFLPKPPKEHSLPKDFRTLPGETKVPLSPKIRLAIRRARRLQSLAIELQGALHHDIVLKIGSVSLSDDPEVVANQTREHFGVNIQTQIRWGNENMALREWIKAIENLGLLVLQMSMPIEDVRALSLTDGSIPVIILNTKDSVKGRIFSLFHEFGHILLNMGGICDPTSGEPWDTNDQNISSGEIKIVEKFCNHFAGALLVPKNEILSHELIKSERIPSEWSDSVLGRVARDFKVSQEVILRRLVILNLATGSFYKRKREEWTVEIEEALEEKKPKLLFSLKLDYKQHLKDGPVSGALRKAFEINNVSLTDEAKITKKDDTHWNMEDGKMTYNMVDADTQIDIYKQIVKWGPPPPRKCVQENGVPFVSLVLESYKKDKITYSDVADYLGIRLKHLPKVEQLVRG
jgi:Zn-dependent peptidase ImmA (M78 family)/transcriptional regulator with XRE-family HTH domain